MEYSFPLGRNGLAEGLETSKFLYMSFVLQLTTAYARKRSSQFIDTKTAIRASNLLSKCRSTPSVMQVHLADRVHFKVLDGLLKHTTELDSAQIAYFPNIASHQIMANINNDPAQPFTFIVLAEDSLGSDRIHVDIQTIFTMYFLSSTKKAAMIDLLDASDGFVTLADGSVEPSPDVLRICPLHVIPDVFGCVSRFEIQHGIHELADTPILEVSNDALLCPRLARSWAQQQRTMSDFYGTSITQHAETVRNTFNLDPTRRRAFVISQDMPWRRNDLEHAQMDSSGPVQYAQVSFVCETYRRCAPRPMHVHSTLSLMGGRADATQVCGMLCFCGLAWTSLRVRLQFDALCPPAL